jgi:hypothetical protein
LAAYAQTLVLAIFMGGMALGAWLASRFSLRLLNPFFAYAITEVVVGFLALLFHNLFVTATDFSYFTIVHFCCGLLESRSSKICDCAKLIGDQESQDRLFRDD